VWAPSDTIQENDDSGAPACRNKKTDKRQGTVRAHDFTESPWGARARNITLSCKGLSEESWESIIEHASKYLGSEAMDALKGDAVDDDDDADTFNLHANIDLDW
jgi:hypothetical protein